MQWGAIAVWCQVRVHRNPTGTPPPPQWAPFKFKFDWTDLCVGWIPQPESSLSVKNNGWRVSEVSSKETLSQEGSQGSARLSNTWQSIHTNLTHPVVEDWLYLSCSHTCTRTYKVHYFWPETLFLVDVPWHYNINMCQTFNIWDFVQ